jgi:hypothetical protein
MEPKHTKSKDQEASVESLDSQERLKELLDPISQPTSIEKSEDEPVFYCKGDFVRNLKLVAWIIAALLILAIWTSSVFLSFFRYVSGGTSWILTAIVIACALLMQLKKEKTWVKVFRNRIEWSSPSLKRLTIMQRSAYFPYSIQIWAGIDLPVVKSPMGNVVGRLPMLQWADLIGLVSVAQRLEIPVSFNVLRPFNQGNDGCVFAELTPFSPMKLLAIFLPLLGIAVTIFLSRSRDISGLISVVPIVLFSLISVLIQIYLYAKRKGRTGILFGRDTITRIKSDEVIWSLTAGDIRYFEYKATAVFVQIFAVTQYGRRHEIKMAPYEALRFSFDNGIPFIQRGKAPDNDVT